MNIQSALIVAAIALTLSFLSALIGSVPFFDALVRAVIWAIIAGAVTAGAETVLRSQLPELFQPLAESNPEDEPADPLTSGGRVDIVLEEEPETGIFVEEEDSEADAPAPPAPETRPVASASLPPTPPPAPVAEAPVADADEPMPEISSFLEAFKPQSEDDSESGGGGESLTPAAPDYADYSPRELPEEPASSVSNGDSGPQDPVILAKAIQTVMKKA